MSAYIFPTVSLGDVLLHTLVGRLNGQRIMNTFWYECNGLTVPNPTINAACANFDAAMELPGGLHQKYLLAMPANFTLVERWTQIIAPVRYIKFPITDGRTGGSLLASEAQNLAAVYERRSGLSGRGFVSTVHLPVATDILAIDTGFLTAAQKVLVQNVATANQASINPSDGSTWDPIIYRRPKLSPPVPSRVTLIFDAFVNDRVRVMRRRTVGLGI